MPLKVKAPSKDGGGMTNPGVIQDHYDKASSVCGHIDDLVGALTELYEDNARWKARYVSTKKNHFSKFLGASGSILVTTTFRDWKAFVLEQVSAKKYDALRATQDATEAEWSEKLKLQETEHEKRLAALEANHKLAMAELTEQINVRNQQVAALQAEKDAIMAKGGKSYKVLQTLKNQLDALDDEDAVDPNAPASNNFEFLKSRLHDLLNQVDPKYVPPLGSLSLMPPPQSA